ncbi:MAG: hypothetical protein SchgKO_16430 [Schleiferiaceae bacterium]
MKRIHLFEWEDLQWFPKSLRNYGTDFLQFLSNKTSLYKPVVPLLAKAMKGMNQNQILDLASGGGGGWQSLSQELQTEISDLKITLTDYFPNLPAFKRTAGGISCVEYSTERVDARDVPKDLKGFRTQFLSFHHFRPTDALAILQNAVDSKSGLAIVEAQERSLPSILAMVFSPITLLLTTPFIRPFSLGRILFTYLIPIMPLMVLWDGVVSCFRTYSVSEMEALVWQLQNAENTDFNIGKLKSGPGVVLYLIAVPKG